MADNITFNSIAADTPLGGVFLEIDPSQALGNLVNAERKVLVVGQRLESGNIPALTPVRVLSAADEENKFGRGSMLHNMFATVATVIDEVGLVDVYAVALDDNASGTAAGATVTLSGQVATARAFALYIGGVQVQAAASVGDTAAALATKLAAAINANTALPVSAAAAEGVVTITSRHKGEAANGLEVAWHYYDGDELPNGIGCTIAGASNGVGKLSGGTGNPKVAQALAAVAEDWFYSVACPYTDEENIKALENDFDGRWGGMDMRTAHGFFALDGTHAELTTAGDKRNSAHSTIWGLKGCPTWTAQRAAALAVTCQFYGSNDPALPLKAVKVPGVLAPRLKDRFSYNERTLLVRDGISTTTVSRDGNIYLERIVTTYQENSAGIADSSLSSLEAKWTVDYYRYVVRTQIGLKFPRHKLVDDGTNIAPGQRFVSPQIISDLITAIEADLETAGIVEQTDTSRKRRKVVRSLTDPNRINAVLPPNLVNQFRTFAATVQYRL